MFHPQIDDQSDQMRLWKNSPKCSPTHLYTTFSWKKEPQLWTMHFCNFQKTDQRKQSPNGRKFAQSGHPVDDFLIFWLKCVIKITKPASGLCKIRNLTWICTRITWLGLWSQRKAPRRRQNNFYSFFSFSFCFLKLARRHSGHRARLQTRRWRIRIPPRCMVFRSLCTLQRCCQKLNVHFHCAYLRNFLALRLYFTLSSTIFCDG
jgi:hypothetical protein